MTTLFNFAPSNAGPVQFQPTLDGDQYTATILWLTFGQRWYVRLTDSTGGEVFNLPLIGSPVGLPIESLVYDSLARQVVLTTTERHGHGIGAAVRLTVAGAVPVGFNGVFDMIPSSPTTFVYPLASDPGSVTSPGALQANISLTDGYFASTLVYREANRQFEVNP